MIFLKNKASLLVILIFSITIVSLNIKWPPKNIMNYDVFGYYLYLPGTFIYHQLEFRDLSKLEKVNEKYQCTPMFYQLSRADNGKDIDRYTMGLAFIYLPFFLIAHIIAIWFDYPVDGFSPPYQILMLIGGFIYSILGVYFLRKVLLKYLNDLQAAITLALIVFGTNYIYDAAFKGAMPHNLLFTVYALILWFTIRWHESQKTKFAVSLGLLCGLAILSRPTEIVCLLIPLFWGIIDKNSLKDKLHLFREHYRQLLLAGMCLVLVGLPQIIYWKVITGKFLFYSYANPGEGLDFLNPHTWNVLFSFRKGWLIYSPIMVFSIIGILLLYKMNRSIFIPLLIFFILNLYLVSSWTNWWYAESYGQRALIQSLSVLALPFGYYIKFIAEHRQVWLKLAVALLSIAFITLNSFQIWQLNHGILDASRMTRSYYLSIFGQTSGPTPGQKKLLIIPRPSTSIEHLTDDRDFIARNLKWIDFENPEAGKESYYDTLRVHSGKFSFQMDSTMQFSPGYFIKFKDLTKKNYAWIRAAVWVYPTSDVRINDGLLVVTFSHKGKYYKYRGRSLSDPEFDVKLNQWNRVVVDYMTPEVRSGKDELSVYFWYQGKQPIYVDDLKVEVFEEKDN